MQRSGEDFREAAASYNRGRSKPGWRYPTDLRRLAVAYGVARRRAGRPLSEIARELGIPSVNLRRWLEAEGVEDSSVAALSRFRPIVVRPVEEVPSAPLCVITRSGLRIEGLALVQVVELVRAVG